MAREGLAACFSFSFASDSDTYVHVYREEWIRDALCLHTSIQIYLIGGRKEGGPAPLRKGWQWRFLNANESVAAGTL